MKTANISVTSADPEELTNELAIATADMPQPPSELRVNGVALDRLGAEPGWSDAPQVWQLAPDGGAWTVVVHDGAEWQVLDIFRCVDLAEQLDGESGRPEVYVVPAGPAWIVARAAAGAHRQVGLHIDADGVAIWQTRDTALAAARRIAQAAGRDSMNA